MVFSFFFHPEPWVIGIQFDLRISTTNIHQLVYQPVYKNQTNVGKDTILIDFCPVLNVDKCFFLLGFSRHLQQCSNKSTRGLVPLPQRKSGIDSGEFFGSRSGFFHELGRPSENGPLDIQSYLDVSENSGTPKSSIFNRVFHYKPSILGYHYFWKHPPAEVWCFFGMFFGSN